VTGVQTCALPISTPPALRARLRPAAGGETHDFLLATGPKGKEIFLRQKDIRQLQLASGAIAAATRILLRHAGLRAADLREVLVAGGFGYYIRRTHAKRIGLLPDLADEHIRFLGNTSLLGAKAVLCCRERAAAAEAVAAQVQFVDVSLDPEFQTEFADAMLLREFAAGGEGPPGNAGLQVGIAPSPWLGRRQSYRAGARRY
jgi:uncharacterized 2Fe-2S/4Fe-4S cluster protein (DUF4445 family)